MSRFFSGLWTLCVCGVVTATAQEATVKENNVNVRGRAGFIGEVITRLNAGDVVNILEPVAIKPSKAGEPANWYRITLPANIPVWVHSSYVDSNGAVSATRLKVRGGPGINYSVLGFVTKGTTVTELQRKGEWTEIQPVPGLHAFIAANMVQLKSPAAPKPGATETVVSESSTIVADTVTEPAPGGNPAESVTVVAEEETDTVAVEEVGVVGQKPVQPVATAPKVQPLPGTSTAIVAEPAPAIVASNPGAGRPLTPEERARLVLEERTRKGQRWVVVDDPDDALLKELPEVRRQVTRDGIIGRNASIQSPSDFSLYSESNDIRLNYLYSSSKNLPLKELVGVRVRISGEEGIDPRWPRTPVLLIKTLDIIP